MTNKNTNTTARKRARREANMATSTKSRAADRRKRPNYGKRKGETKKVDECQLCDTPTPLKDQYTVVNEKDEDGTFTGKAIKTKIGRGAAKHPDNLSHYCGDCADKRVKQKEAWVARRLADGESKPKATGRKRGAAKKEEAKTSGRKRGAAKARTRKRGDNGNAKAKPKDRKAPKADTAKAAAGADEDPF